MKYLKCILVAGVVMSNCATARGQSNQRLVIQGPADQAGGVIRDAVGKACLDVEAAARAQVVIRDVYDHVVSIKNNCPRTIKVKLCYYNSESCKQFDMPGYKRIDTILGSAKGVSLFRYSLSQR